MKIKIIQYARKINVRLQYFAIFDVSHLHLKTVHDTRLWRFSSSDENKNNTVCKESKWKVAILCDIRCLPLTFKNDIVLKLPNTKGESFGKGFSIRTLQFITKLSLFSQQHSAGT